MKTTKQSESELSKQIQLEALKHKCILYRNNQGGFKDKTGRFVFFGLGNTSKKLSDKWKTSDLIGYTVVEITPDMVGKKVAVFTAIEVKRKGATKDARYKAQENFTNQVRNNGGIASIINSLETLKDLFKSFWTQG